MEGALLLDHSGSATDWTTRMENGERALERMRVALKRLQADDEETCVRRTVHMNGMREQILSMRAFVEDCLCGRNEFEQAMMCYKIRIEFPLYSHLNTVFALTPASQA